MVNVLAECADGSTKSSLQVRFKVVNPGTQNLSWSDIKVRYYYTTDGTVPIVEFLYLQNTTWNNMKSLVVVTPTAKYVEFGWASGAGTLYALDTTAGSGEIQVLIHPPDYHNWDTSQLDDPSFSDSAHPCLGTSGTVYNPRTSMPAYVGGRLVWGTEPPP
jgi:hypothetical protein